MEKALPDTGSWSTALASKWLAYLERDSVRKSIQTKLVDPILQHILKQVFPYVLLICIMFILLLFAVLITLGVILFSVRPVIAVAQA
jgi:hypothetical protein